MKSNESAIDSVTTVVKAPSWDVISPPTLSSSPNSCPCGPAHGKHGQPCPQSDQCPYGLYCQLGSGDHWGNVGASNWEDCERKCIDKGTEPATGCSGYTFHACAGNQCWLHKMSAKCTDRRVTGCTGSYVTKRRKAANGGTCDSVKLSNNHADGDTSAGDCVNGKATLADCEAYCGSLSTCAGFWYYDNGRCCPKASWGNTFNRVIAGGAFYGCKGTSCGRQTLRNSCSAATTQAECEQSYTLQNGLSGLCGWLGMNCVTKEYCD